MKSFELKAYYYLNFLEKKTVRIYENFKVLSLLRVYETFKVLN
jgi:hypothetical protein